MPFPPGVQQVTVTAGASGYHAPDGTAYEGTIRFTPSVSRVTSAEHGVITLGPTNATLSASGMFTKTLLATDASGFSPSGWTYRVDEEFTNAPGRSYNISLPASATNVALPSLAPVEEADGTAYTPAVLSVNGDTGVVTGLLEATNSLSDVASVSTARSNLGLGNSATRNVGTITGTVAAGDDSRITGALPASGGTVTGDLAVAGRLTASGFALPMAIPSAPRPAYRAASWAQQFQAGHGWTASGSGVASSNANDTTVFCRGTQSFGLVTTGTGAVANVRRLGSALPDLTGKALRLIFRISDVTYLNQINVQVGSSSLANYFQWRLHTHASTAENQVLSGEWAVMTLSWADVRSAAGTYSISSTGVPSTTSGFTDLLVQFVDNNTANPITINLQAIEIVPDTTETFPNGVVSITFDDSYATQATGARPKMDTLGFRGTLYTICDVIGTGGYLTLPQLQSVQANSGWEIAGHAYSVANHNAKYNTLPAATVEDDVRKTRMWMVSNGFTSDSFAYPGGWFSKTSDNASIEALTCRYFSNGRGISSADNLESFPPPAPYRMRSITGIGSLAGASARGLPANLTGNGGALDRCQLDGSWTILTFHEITAGAAATTNQCSQADFDLIMDGIAARGIPVLPVGDVLRLYS